MQYDRKITISAGSNRRAMSWLPQTMLISELWARLQTPARGTEPLAEYLNMKKAQQDDLKDVGGFMAGTLSGPRRKAGNVTGRDVITLDLDNIPSGGTDDVLRRVEALGCGYCIYSTRKHSPAAPRLRVLIPLDRTVSADEYEPLARKMAEYIGLELCDPTTFEVSRLMYWPSCCADSQYIYLWQDKPLLSANGLLAQYEDWRDCTTWPQVPGALSLPKLAVKQGDPEGKTGVVGAFCRTYDIYRAMDELIPGMYEPVESMPGRYTYLGGSTTGGAVVYDSGKFLYSHHATDPCGGRLVNAFDLVRLHRFGDKDDDAQTGTPANRLPSYRAMCELAVQDKDVAALMSQERYQEALQDFEGVTASNDAEPANWMSKLAVNTQTGLPKATIDNVWIILENDPLLKGKFALNQFAGRGEVLGALPWDDRTERRLWDDNDNQGLYWYMERYHHITGNGKIDGALSLHSTAHAFNEIQDYLRALVSDTTPDTNAALEYAVGDVVTFKGTKHYASSNGTNGKTCKPGEARVTSVAKNGKHQYHLIKTTGSTSTVYGWVDAADITKSSASIAKGSKVKVNKGAKTYTGGSLASFVYSTVYTAMQIDGDRVVIGKDGVVTAAVNIKNLTLVG